MLWHQYKSDSIFEVLFKYFGHYVYIRANIGCSLNE